MPGHDAVVRPASTADLDALLDLFESVASERLWIGTELGFDRARYRSNWVRMLGEPNSALFLACDGDRIVGSLNAYPHDEYGIVIGMLVDAGYRRCGIGRRLLERAMAWARSRGAPEIALYRSMGFVQRAYYERDVTRSTGEVWDTILMTRSI